MKKTSAYLAATALAALGATSAMAQQQPTGVWIDHTGRGAVEIADCGGGALCGYVVWVKDAKNKQACRTQIIGNAKPVGGGAWDRGWIVDPDDNQRYSVELKPLPDGRLRVTGYMGSKMFSETMVWKRAPGDLARCDVQEAKAPAAPVPVPVPLAAVPAVPPPVVAPPAPIVQAAPVLPGPVEPAPVVTLPREAAPLPPVPSIVAPEAMPVPAPPRAAKAAKQQRTSRQASNSGKRKTASRDCKLEVPYYTVRIPCDLF